MKLLNPIALFLIPFAVAFLIFTAKKGGFSASKKFYIVLRSIICILLILAIGSLQLTYQADITTTIFAVDTSASVKKQLEKQREFLNQAQKNATENDRAGLVCFGQRAAVEKNPSSEFSVFELNSFVGEEGTNIEGALTLAANMIPENTKKRIVLLSDGEQTVQDAMLFSKIASQRNIQIDVYLLESSFQQEVQLSSLRVPEYVAKNMDYSIELVVDSLTDTSADIKLYKGNRVIVQEQLTLRQGENNFVFTDHSGEGGGVIYRAEISSAEDTLPENNIAYGYCYVKDVPSVLILEKEKSGTELSSLLISSQVNVTLTDASLAPRSIEELSIYDAVVLANISTEDLPENFGAVLENYVRHIGGGLLATGGDNSYALGGYYGTVLEEILPVDMELKTDSQQPNLAMVLVIDHSGSMSDNRYGMSIMEIAKEAAIRSTETLKEEDFIGVVAFDMKPTWTVPIQTIGQNKQKIQDSIATIQPAGGTSILPALQTAYESLQKIDAKRKHILLLTDGQAEQTGYEQVLNGIHAGNMTLSTIAVGSGADTKLLKTLAERGNGRYYLTNEFTDLPEIFMKEVFLAGKEYLNQRTFFPVVSSSSPILNGIEEVTSLDGYIATTAKPRAQVIFQSDQQEPILAVWQYGLGRSASWLSDINGNWSGKWLDTPQGVQVFRNTISYLLRGQNENEISITAKQEQDSTSLTVTMPYNKDVTKVDAVVLAADNTQYPVSFTAVSPGIYQGNLPVTKQGAYITSVLVSYQDETIQSSYTGFHLPYSKEYDIRAIHNGRVLLEQLAAQTGGRILSSAENVFDDISSNVQTQLDMTNFLLILALLLFLLDVTLHRFSWVLEKAMQRKTEKLKSKPKEEEPKQQKKTSSLEEKKEESPKIQSSVDKLANLKRKREKK